MDTPNRIQPARKPTIIFAVCMIAAGVLLFLGNLGLLPIHRVWDLWPLIFTFVGFGQLAGRRTPGTLLLGVVFVIIGIIASLFTTGVFHLQFRDNSWWISLLLIAFGVSGLARVLDGEPWHWHFGDRHAHHRLARHQRRMGRVRRMSGDDAEGDNAFQFNYSVDTDPILNNYTMMGNIKRKVESQNFQGGKLTSILGSIEIDLRRAKMPEGRKIAELEVNATLGHIALRVPDAWRVLWTGDNVLGNFEDKTIPPNTGPDAPQLIITGSCTMGSIEIES